MDIQTFAFARSLMNTSKKKAESSLINYIFQSKENKLLLIIAIASGVIEFTIFKILYPFPDFISDSYSYIATNLYDMKVNLWPVGYSKFLWLVHQISSSDTFLVGIQYTILQISFLYFFFSILYLYGPQRQAKLTLYIFLFFNPMPLYLSNCILSDSLFAALTIVFIVQFLWMLYAPSTKQIIAQGIIIGITFTLRYTAIYYPIVAFAGLLLSKQKLVTKMWGTLIGVFLMSFFVLYTKEETKKVTGTAEFSVFGGWQLANNALYMYNYIIVDSNNLPIETRSLDRVAKNFFQKLPPSRGELAVLPGTYFIKVPWAVLKPYMVTRYSFDDPPSQFKAWGKVSPIYNKYGYYLITHFPVSFARYYLLLNTKNYLLPHLEKFGDYNIGIYTVPGDVQDWFGYKTPYIYAISTSLQGKIFYVYPYLFMILNVYFAAFIIWISLKGRHTKMNPFLKKSIIFICLFLACNFAFSVFATPVVLRYQVTPMILLLTFLLLLLEFTSNPTQISNTKTST